MTSVQAFTKQVDTDQGYFITLGSLFGQVYGYTPSSGNTGVAGGTISTASWAYFGPGLPVSTIIQSSGVLLKDMGKTVVSSFRTFRKIQLVLNGKAPGASAYTYSTTNGVGGKSGTNPYEDYYTGYIEMGFDGNGTPAPVARFGR
jgi:hypothetical protein